MIAFHPGSALGVYGPLIFQSTDDQNRDWYELSPAGLFKYV